MRFYEVLKYYLTRSFISRSATIVTAYLMKYERLKFHVALAKVKSSRPIVNPNTGFQRQLEQFEKALTLLGDTDDDESQC